MTERETYKAEFSGKMGWLVSLLFRYKLFGFVFTIDNVIDEKIHLDYMGKEFNATILNKRDK